VNRMLKRFLIPVLIISVVLTAVYLGNKPDPNDSNATTLRRGMDAEPESLDPHRFTSNSAAAVLRDIGEGLLSYSPQGDLVGGVAESWTISDDRLVYEFKLRENNLWSNGAAVTADDFVSAFRRLLDPDIGSPYAGALSIVKNANDVIGRRTAPENLGVYSLDDLTLRIVLESPAPYFLQLLTHPSTFPIYRPALEKFGDDFSRPGNHVSNGAYLLTDRVIGSSIVLESNKSYWDAVDDGYSRVVYQIVAESAEANLFRAGDLDVTWNIDASMLRKLREERPAEVRVSPYLGVVYFGFNMQSEVFSSSPDLRKALSMAVDRELLVEAVLGRGEEPAFGWVPPGISGYPLRQLDYASISKDEREENAREIFARAGYDHENPLRFELRYNTSDVQTRIAVALQSMWRDVLGAEVTLVNEEFGVLLSNIQAMNVTEMFRLSWTGDYNDPLTFLQLFVTNDPSNLTGYSNSEYDALLAKAAGEKDPAARLDILADAEYLAISEHPVIPLYFFVSKHLVRNSVAGWTDSLLDIHYSKHLRPQIPTE